MNAPKTVVVVMRSDGKLMPPRWWDFPPEERQRLADLAHHLRCGLHLSYKQVQRAMMQRYGERRSIGAIWRDVRDFQCSYCSGEPRPASATTPAAPPPAPATTPPTLARRPDRVPAEVFEWR